MPGAVCPCVLLLLLAVLSGWIPLRGAQAQELQEQDALCNAEGCYAVYIQRKTFRDSWRTCREKGGNLASVKSEEEAALIHELLSAPRRNPRARVRLWIGLQRQPRQCSATKPLRGFAWTNGDQDTEYTNWQREDQPSTCSAPRCVVMTQNTLDKSRSGQDNFKWLDGSCGLAVDGFLCRFPYRGMCQPLTDEGAGAPLYTTPFNLASTLLTHVPFGSVAKVPCPEGTKEDQSVLCTEHEGIVSWSRGGPYCSDEEPNWCEQENGGCEHLCLKADGHYYCACRAGFELAEDGQSCMVLEEDEEEEEVVEEEQPIDPCEGAPCEYHCEPTGTGRQSGYRCTCAHGYLLAPDGRSCVDIDECQQAPCPQLCVNAPGTFECRCLEGYRPDENGDCVDVDECLEDSCEQICVNTVGSFECHCADGYTQVPEDPVRCQDVDECESASSCGQVCRNYQGGFECQCDEGYELEDDYYTCRALEDEEDVVEPTPANPHEPTEPSTLDPAQADPSWSPAVPDWLIDPTPLEWLTEQPNFQWLPTDISWFPEGASDEGTTQDTPHGVERDNHHHGLTFDLQEENTHLGSDTPRQQPGRGQGEGAFVDTDDHLLPRMTEEEVLVHLFDEGDVGVVGGGEKVSSPSSSSSPPPSPQLPPSQDSERNADRDSGSASGGSASASGGSESSEDQRPPAGGKRRHDKSWLLVALLVPLCVFTVVMLALGIVYCTSCAVEPRSSKRTKDCYRWFTASKPPAEATNNGKSRA
ncbi:endosialin [Engraulis encrasicolus]|uniref:endosialin n=1 Tax=Engraulis encrasicolus TaxID=184585 RepID=UPI002FCEC6CD